MGVPEFLNFVVRISPASFCRISKNGTAGSLCFDFVLIDATNAYQTAGLETLLQFLKNPQLRVARAIIFAMDAQRHYAGTSRGHRTYANVLDLDVSIQRLCSELQDHYKLHAGDASPQVLISGRQVAGEADYKILDMQREIVTLALASGLEVPTFCLISEDSDVLCGALCGPAPQKVSIATKLNDTVFDMCILRLSHVLAHIAVCVEAVSDDADGYGVHQIAETQGSHNDVVNTLTWGTGEEKKEEVVHQKMKDDLMTAATGNCTRVVFADSDSDEEADKAPPQVQEFLPSASAISARHIAAAEIIHNSCVDLVFLFVVIMGNGGNLSPVIRGATKVDIQSCWTAYCRMKYHTAKPGREKEMGRNLLCLHDAVERPEQQSDNVASISVDCSFLLAILESAHYADSQSRPPLDEEKERAMFFLSQAVYSTLRYIVACNVYSDSPPENTLLDARSLTKNEVDIPNFAAFLWALGYSKKRTLHFPLSGLATGKLLSNATCGLSAVEAAINAERSLKTKVSQNVLLHGNIGNTLTTTDSGLTRTVQLRKLLRKAPPGGCKDMVTCINNCLEKGAIVGSAPQGSRSAPFSRLVFLWQRTIAPYLPTLEAIVRKDHILSPLTGSAMDGEATCAPVNGFMASKSENMRISYSFELRRMAPVLLPSGDATSAAQSSTSVSQNAALLNALRVSYDYAQSPPMTRFADAASGKRQRLEKLRLEPKQQRQSEGNGKHPARRHKCGVGVDDTANIAPTDLGSVKYRRLGKKERQMLRRKRQD